MNNDELRELLQRATPGEWQAVNPYQWDSIIGDIDGPDDGEMHYESVTDITSHHDRSRVNAALIAAMHNALPRLLADSDELAALKARIAEAPVGELFASFAPGAKYDYALADAEGYPIDLSHLRGQRVALLRLPAGEAA